MDSLNILVALLIAFGVLCGLWILEIMRDSKDLPVLRPEFVDDPVVDLPPVSYTLKLTHLGEKPALQLKKAIRCYTGISLHDVHKGVRCLQDTSKAYLVLDDVPITILRDFLDTVSLDYTFGKEIDFSLQVLSYDIDRDKILGNYKSIGDWKGEMVAHE